MAVLFTCPNPRCPDSDVVIEFVTDPGAEPQCDCGAILDPAEPYREVEARLVEPPMPAHSGVSPRGAH